jgi:hypothetical protein
LVNKITTVAYHNGRRREKMRAKKVDRTKDK